MHTLRMVCGGIVIILALSVATGAQQIADEYQVKAAYLYTIAKLGRWPAQKLPEKSDLVIGVFGGNEDFVRVLRDIMAGKTINGHTLEVRQLRAPKDLKFCHIVFFGESQDTTPGIIEQFGKSPILLVGEDKNFLSEGGMINLAQEDGKMTYLVNSAALERSGLTYDDSNTANGLPGTTDGKRENSRVIVLRVRPEYPRIAATLKIIGAVQMQAMVRKDGTVKQVRVVGGHPVLAEAAAAAVMKWRFEAGAKETMESVKISFGE
jgi:TonB family protein